MHKENNANFVTIIGMKTCLDIERKKKRGTFRCMVMGGVGNL